MTDDKTVDKAVVQDTPRAEATVAVVMARGSRGGRPRRWMTGKASWLRGVYDFVPCCPTDVLAEDARKLIAGGPEVEGRVFVRADTPDGVAALAAAVPKARW